MKKAVSLIVAILLTVAVLTLGITQEVPLGAVSGTITLGDSSMPLPEGLVTLTPVGTSEDDAYIPRTLYAETDREGRFEIRKVPVGAYQVEVSAKYHSLRPTTVFIEEGEVRSLDLRLKRGIDQLTVYNSQRVITPEEEPSIEVHGFFTSDDLRVEVRQLDLDALAKSGGIQQVSYPLTNSDASTIGLLKASPVVRKFTQKVADKDAEGAFVNRLKLSALPEGLYWLTVNGAKLHGNAYINVSRLALVTKSYADQLLCFATDLESGKPVRGVEILTATDRGLKLAGRTDEVGLLSTQLPPPTSGQMRSVVARRGKSLALVGMWSGGAERPDIRMVGYTDRPIYRPGDTVKFKGVMRRVVNTVMSPVTGGEVKLEFRNSDGEVIDQGTTQLSEHGTFHGEFATSAEGKPGYYTILAKVGDAETSIGAQILAYRKPEYKITIRPNGGPFVIGQSASVSIDCEYYFGGPVVGATVKAGVYRNPVWPSSDDEDYNVYDSSGSGEYSQEIEAVTDDAGRAVITFPTRVEGDALTFDNDYEYHVYASVADQGGKYFDGEGSVVVHRGKVDLSLESDRWFANPGETVVATGKVTDSADAAKPIGNQEVSVEISEWRWTENTSVEIPRRTLSVRTDSDGSYRVEIPTEKGGDFQLRAKTKDSDGRPVTASTSFWVNGAVSGRPRPSLSVMLDRKSYRPGETAQVMLQTDQPGGSALLTIQANGVLRKQVVALTESSTVVKIPVSRVFAPNVFVSAAYVHGKEFAEDTRKLRVDNEERKLAITVTSARGYYRPGETATVKVQTRDMSGRPVPAEVSLAVVDESIYAIQEDDTDLQAMLDPNRYDQVQTNYSFPEVYLDGGDKGGGDIPLRKRFEDTAAWMPTVWTGILGEAEVQVPLPDNLTTWRVTAQGVADDGAAGKGVAKFQANKPLMVRISQPGFLVEGDETEVAVSVTNATGKDQTVRLDVTATGMRLQGDARPQIQVAQGATASVRLKVQAERAGSAVLTARAWSDETNTDGVEARLMIRPHGRKDLTAAAGQAEPRGSFALVRQADSDPETGMLTLNLSPTLAGGVIQSLDGLVDYPYGCVEQTMSRFMPAVVVQAALDRLGLQRPALSQKIPKVARDSMARLARMQHGDGGWGWWEYGASDPFMTALVLDGLDRSAQAGYPAQGIRLKEAVQWSETALKSKMDLRSQLYLSYAVLRHGGKVPSLEKVDLKKASAAELATAALAFDAAGLSGRADEALNQLIASAEIGPRQANWPSSENAWGEEPNALALVALEKLRPQHTLIPRVVAGLMSRRKAGGWTSTRDTAYTVVGLTAALAKSRQGGLATKAIIRINGQELRKVLFDPTDTEGVQVTIPVRDLPFGEFRVEIEGNGSLYYNADLQQFRRSDPLTAVSHDPNVDVTRVYRVMQPRKLEDGTTRLLPSEKPVSEAAPGDLIQVELTLDAKRDAEYVLIEDPIPSNCHITEREEIGIDEEWGWWWSRTVVLDDRVAFFAQTLPKGKNKVSYMMRAELPGLARALPTYVERMYEPERWVSPAENRLAVKK